MSPASDITRQISAARRGDKSALDALLPLVYGELRKLARSSLARERAGHTLQPTALVHEAYMRLTGQGQIDWANRAHLMAMAATMMRRVLAEHAERRGALKRGGGALQVTLDPEAVGGGSPGVDLLALDQALGRLAALDPQQARVVELRYLGGLTIEETAEALSISPATAKREWTMARAWLLRELSGPARG
ncbi:MAG: sigma-70 family RNA polymerase sigma factor [Bryobacteraceae bacterium]